jgi:AhpD family alkylhydroperoxidase
MTTNMLPGSVPLIDASGAPLLARPYFSDGDPGPIVAALAQVPELLDVAMPFLAVVLGPSSVSLRRKELVILRTSSRLGCRFCIDAHTVAASTAGLTGAELVALRGERPISEAFSDPCEAQLLAWVDVVACGRAVEPRDREALGGHLGPHELVEVTLLVGATMMLNRFCTALALPSGPATTARLDELGLR